jgi:uncharacterized protein (TIGR00725 family)
MKIAIFSSADSVMSNNNKELALGIINYLKKYNVTLVTGGSLGIPGFMIEEYKKIGGNAIMYSPDPCSISHKKRHDNHDIHHYDQIIFGTGFTQRSLKMINNVDGAIALNGRTGTLCEILIAIEESLPVIVIDSAEGVCEHFEKILSYTNKEPFGFCEIGSSYGNQIDKLISHIKKHS